MVQEYRNSQDESYCETDESTADKPRNAERKNLLNKAFPGKRTDSNGSYNHKIDKKPGASNEQQSRISIVRPVEVSFPKFVPIVPGKSRRTADACRQTDKVEVEKPASVYIHCENQNKRNKE